MELAVIELDGAAVLHAAMKGLHFAIAQDGASDAGRGNRQRDDEEREKEDGRKQNVALLVTGDGPADSGRSGVAADWVRRRHANAQCADSVSVCVLL